MAWWVGPFPSDKNPGTKLLNFTGMPEMPTSVRTNSKARMVKKAAKACTMGFLPRRARPVAAPIMVCSVIPVSMKRAPKTGGKFLTNALFSAVMTTTSSCESA